MANWVLKKNGGDLAGLVKNLGISETTARVLLNRGVRTPVEARKFLRPEIASLAPISSMSGVTEAYEIIKDSLIKNERIIVYGDYDADGVMSVVILMKALARLGADCSYYIPQRGEEGYGLNHDAVSKLKEFECDLLITVDNGVSAMLEVEQAKALGMRVIVIDHHEPGFVGGDGSPRVDVLPNADAIIDPKIKSNGYPFKNMCAAALCHRFADGLLARSGIENESRDESLIFACIATFCDIVGLIGENRTIAKAGLDLINVGVTNLGLAALLAERGIDRKKIGGFEVGFIIGPCINAGGRLETAGLAAELFLTDDEAEAARLARRLNELNEERKAMTADAFNRIMGVTPDPPVDKVLVIYDEKIHESVAGIVAGRLKDRLRRPVLVLADGKDCVKGSARSIDGYNIFEELYARRGLFRRFGGHAMAAGLTLDKSNVDALRDSLNEGCELTEEDFAEVVRIDAALGVDAATYELADELRALEPFGVDNGEPLFGAKGVEVAGLKTYAEKNTTVFTLAAGAARTVRAVCFGKNDAFKKMICGRYDGYEAVKILGGVTRTAGLALDFVYSVGINEYNGNTSVELKIKDFRLSDTILNKEA